MIWFWGISGRCLDGGSGSWGAHCPLGTMCGACNERTVAYDATVGTYVEIPYEAPCRAYGYYGCYGSGCKCIWGGINDLIGVVADETQPAGAGAGNTASDLVGIVTG